MPQVQTSPRRPFQMHNPSVPSSPAAHTTNPDATLHIDLLCHETMPAPSELGEMAQLAQFESHIDILCPAPSRDGMCWCLDACAPDRVCNNLLLPRKRQRSPSPRDYKSGVDDTWIQEIRIFHPTDFSYTMVGMNCGRAFKEVFAELCASQRVDRKRVSFVWIRKRRRGGVQQVRLSDTDKPWLVGMQEGVLETIECEFC